MGRDVALEGCLSFPNTEDFIAFPISVAFYLEGVILIFSIVFLILILFMRCFLIHSQSSASFVGGGGRAGGVVGIEPEKSLST